MRWSEPSEKVKFWLLSPIIVPVAIICTPPLLIAVSCMWLAEKAKQPFRASPDWHTWYAWRPIKINDWFCDNELKWVWFEAVERRGHHSWTEYRTIANSPKTPAN
jgi:hypothetical protein